MADALSNYMRDKLNDLIFSATSFSSPGTLYFALMTVMPTASGGGTEVTGGSYARVSKTNNATNFPASSGQVKNNGTVIDWGTATANWGTVVGVAIYDASTSGNLIAFGSLSTSRTVNSGDSFSIPVNGMTFNWAA